LVGFRAAYVFDVSQTEGQELPEFSERVSGNAGEYRDRLVDFVIAQGIALEFKESIAPALGMSYGGKIALLPGQASAEEFSTLVHELAHEMLHKAERRTATTKTLRETEAEAVALWSERPSDLRPAGHRLITSTCMTAMPRCSLRAWK